MTFSQRVATYAITVIVGLTLLVVTGLTFLVEPMAEDLDLSDAAVELALVVPSIAALLVVFVAGRAGDKFGERQTIVVAGAIFTAGALVIATGSRQSAITIGLALCGASAVVIQVVAFSLLQRTAPEGSAHVSAFTTFGMVFPIAFLVFPIATSYVLDLASWRWIPVAWALAGVAIVVISWVLLDHGRRGTSSGEWFSPMLAGIALAAGSQFLDELGIDRRDPQAIFLLAGGCLVAAVACISVMRRAKNPGLSLKPIAGVMLRPLLIGVALVALIQILTYVSIAMEYFYEMSPLEASIAIAPAQLGAVLGAKFVAGRTIRRWGVARAGRGLLLVTGVVMLLLVMVQPSTPIWYLVLVSTVFSLTGMGALTVMNLDIMGRAPEGSAGAVSAYRTAASSLGSALSMVVLGMVVLSSVSMAGGTSDVGETTLVELSTALRFDGLVGFLIALIGWAVLFASARRAQEDRTPSISAGRG
jgi:MFS family permease